MRTAALFGEVSGTDDTVVRLEPEHDPSLSRVIVAAGNPTARRMAERCAALLGAHDINILRAFVDVIDDGANGCVAVLTYVVRSPDGGAIDPDGDLWRHVSTDLARMKWVTDAAIALDRASPATGLTRCETVSPSRASRTRPSCARTCTPSPAPASRRRDASTSPSRPRSRRSSPTASTPRGPSPTPTSPRAPRPCASASTAPSTATTRAAPSPSCSSRSRRRTAPTCTSRSATASRCASTRPSSSARSSPRSPYGLFFVHGLGFDGFHVRFRDIARGGVRVVRPGSPEQLAAETDRVYDEAYGLAFAQQLKNKDIPEGGAKAVIVSSSDVSVARAFKGFADGLLDLLVSDPGGRVIDRFGRPETLYLGPDENITPDLIEWVVARAARRGHKLAASFMSSKPGAGINHKEYGVTSEGVTVFLEVALKAVGIDPRAQDFTVKITGGPDGDVAGNEIKILHREYGSHAKVVGIADGSGSAEDPDGLDHDELLRLVARSEAIACFDPAKLGPRGKVVPVDAPDGVRARNTMHNRVVADVFMPAGGRPQTIHIGNWAEYLLPDGTASSKVIVEGANLFITPEARQKLGEKGVLVLKDSSANKCGVICSSFEITASHLLTEAEFLANKQRFVGEVLVRLRALARAEAELLFRERARNPAVLMPEVSVRLSRAMMRVQDAIDAVLDDLSPEDRALADALVLEHLPPVLREVAGDRVKSRLPVAYARSIVSSSLAARIVYREGLDWVCEGGGGGGGEGGGAGGGGGGGKGGGGGGGSASAPLADRPLHPLLHERRLLLRPRLRRARVSPRARRAEPVGARDDPPRAVVVRRRRGGLHLRAHVPLREEARSLAVHRPLHVLVPLRVDLRPGGLRHRARPQGAPHGLVDGRALPRGGVHGALRGGRSPTGRRGAVSGVLAVTYALVRFPLDFLRATDLGAEGDVRRLGLTPGQWACFATFAFGVWALNHARTHAAPDAPLRA